MAVSIRVILTFLSKMCSDVPYRQRIFLAIAWMPKITLQAIFAGMTLDAAKKNGSDTLKSHGYTKFLETPIHAVEQKERSQQKFCISILE
ncbi:unnamed protein product [Dibothriocephalus latus]|uniref:Uncharacterized protein n=1 Tax=Dibothriocephalus latus TaxID=60516 RepID=A0A3P7L8I7_DIBLA|nr:unnamed protein product [Dibothriocephalus latus]